MPVTAIIRPKQYWVLSVNIVIKACVHVAVLIWLVTQWSPVTVVCWLEPDNDQVVIDRSRVISVCRLYRPPTGQPLSNLFVSTARALIGPIIKMLSQLNNVTITRLTRTITTQKIFSSDCSNVHFIWSSLQENTSAVNEWNFYTTWNWNEFLKDAEKVCLKSFLSCLMSGRLHDCVMHTLTPQSCHRSTYIKELLVWKYENISRTRFKWKKIGIKYDYVNFLFAAAL